ncbi:MULTISPECIES: hypothetical protein [Sphingomonas]|uniref:Uncharacterized protein n=1 Tax=Sphingomonas kyungheensis TaxID=1069987 RepID=A0ABU8GYE4_9SPHN|nr:MULTISPECIES: hypothetical protein [unclassified Sphingomonas]
MVDIFSLFALSQRILVVAAIGLLPPPADQARTLSPPPVMRTYDPIAGPFIVRFGDQSELTPDQLGVVKNAVDNWMGDRLQAFQICFSPPKEIKWKEVFFAVDAVAHALKMNGARVVTAPNGLLCRSAHRPNFGEAYVEIEGVISL